MSSDPAFEMEAIAVTSEFRQHWGLDPAVEFLNHGSFGACPTAVLKAQALLRDEMEREPMTFFTRTLLGYLNSARSAVAEFLGAEAEDLVFVPNATAGVNAVLRSLRFEPGDEILAANVTYCRKAVDFVADRSGARVVVADLPFPVNGDDEIVEAVLEKVTARTRIALLDHVTSSTSVILPIARLVAEIQSRGIDVLVDGAHAPGMIPLSLSKIGAAYYTGNAHKWLCAPKGAAFLHVRRDRQRRSASHRHQPWLRQRTASRIQLDGHRRSDSVALHPGSHPVSRETCAGRLAGDHGPKPGAGARSAQAFAQDVGH